MKVLTTAVNNPLFVEMQFYLLKHFMTTTDYQFVVFNDAKNFVDPTTNQGDLSIRQTIRDTCKKLNIECIDIPNGQHIHYADPSRRCADSMNFILKYQTAFPDEYLVLDSDMFPIAPINLGEYRQFDCALLLQERNHINYFWHGILYFDTRKMKNMALMNWNTAPGFDTGGMMADWLRQQPSWNIYYIKHIPSLTWNADSVPEFLTSNPAKYGRLLDFIHGDPRNQEGAFFCEIYDKKYLHYRAGTNWRNEGLAFHYQLSLELKAALMATVA